MDEHEGAFYNITKIFKYLPKRLKPKNPALDLIFKWLIRIAYRLLSRRLSFSKVLISSLNSFFEFLVVLTRSRAVKTGFDFLIILSYL